MLRIRELREQRHLNQEGLAQKISASQSTISAYETGDRTPDLEMLIRLSKFFGVSIDYLVSISEIKQSLSQNDLTDTERELLLLYRRLPSNRQEKARAYMEGLADI